MFDECDCCRMHVERQLMQSCACQSWPLRNVDEIHYIHYYLCVLLPNLWRLHVLLIDLSAILKKIIIAHELYIQLLVHCLVVGYIVRYYSWSRCIGFFWSTHLDLDVARVCIDFEKYKWNFAVWHQTQPNMDPVHDLRSILELWYVKMVSWGSLLKD